MKLLRIFTAAACAASLCHLTSCEFGGGKIDAVNPTVAEMDQLDTQWGLQPRRSRGAPRRNYNPNLSAPAPSAAAPVREVPSQPAAPATISPEPPKPSSAAVNSLR